jgi:DNA polymerase III subunit epsilon
VRPRGLEGGGVMTETTTWQRDRAKAARWAADLLARPPGEVLILDSETTDLDGYLVELAITDTTGRVVFGARLTPPVDVGDEAAAIHGLTGAHVDEMVPFTAIVEPLEAVLFDRTVVIYNATYDTDILFRELERHYDTQLWSVHRPWDSGYPARWLSHSTWECAMARYSAFVGEIHPYFGDYRWQRLPGGDHTALGDCLATLDVLHTMAAEATHPGVAEEHTAMRCAKCGRDLPHGGGHIYCSRVCATASRQEGSELGEGAAP